MTREDAIAILSLQPPEVREAAAVFVETSELKNKDAIHALAGKIRFVLLGPDSPQFQDWNTRFSKSVE